MNSLLTWDVASFGCIERDTTKVNPAQRTEMSTLGTGRFYSATADRRAPITVHFQAWQTFAQQRALWQWYHNDLHGGALPFRVELWLWDRIRFVRAHFVGGFTSRHDQHYDMRLTAGTFELERESLRPRAQWVERQPQKTAQCIPSRATFLEKGRGVHKATCIPTRYDILVPPELRKAATCVPAKTALLLKS